MSKPKFVRPKDIKTFWKAACCAPATTDENEECGFCGETNRDCALEFSKHIELHPEFVHDGNILGDGQDDPEDQMSCGGSGFWCSGCGRFWAQDSCGNSSAEEHRAADGAKLELKDGSVYCVCDKKLMRQRVWED